MKRSIFLGFLITTVVGLTALSISSRMEVKKMCDKTLVDLMGNRNALGDKKLSLKTHLVDEYGYFETVISKYGIESEGESDGNLYYLNSNKDYQSLDRKITRGFDVRNANENERFQVALHHEREKGLSVRYKNKETNKCGEFSITDKELMTWLNLSNVYVKDDIVYAVLSSYQGSSLFKISLTSEKVLKKMEFPVLAEVSKEYNGDSRTLVKDNKMYIVGYDGSPNYGFLVFTYDLDKETFSYKKTEGINKDLDNCDIYSVERDGNYAYYYVKDDNTQNIYIVVYDINEDKLMMFTVNNKSGKKLEYLGISNCVIQDGKLYLVGSYMEDDRKFIPYVSVFDVNKKTLEYLGYVDEKLIHQISNINIR